MTRYYTSDGRQVLAKDLSRLSTEAQLEVMEFWFRERYEDPVHGLPHESAEGGYIFVNGGPYDANDVLGEEFGASVREGLIHSLVQKLETECIDWTPKNDPRDKTT